MARYKIQWKERFDHIVCHGDYECNRQAFLKCVSEYPDFYKGYTIIDPADSSYESGYEFISWRFIEATNDNDAIQKVLKDHKDIAPGCEVFKTVGITDVVESKRFDHTNLREHFHPKFKENHPNFQVFKPDII